MASERQRIILTPEHVPIRLIPAGLGSRFLALITDFIIVTAVVITVSTALAFIPFGIGQALAITAAFLIQWGYHIFFEVKREGRTPGKRLARLRVVDGRGLPITFEQSLMRNIVRVLDFAPVFYGLGGITCLLDGDRRRLGDLAADTLVIRESQPQEYRSSLGAPRQYNSLRTPSVLRRVRHRVSLEEKEFLLNLCLRAESLDESAKFDLMEQVGGHYREQLGVDDPHLSNENLVRDLTAVLFSDQLREATRAKHREG